MNILLVEDNPADMRMLKDLFEETPKPPTLAWVTDGYEALDYVFQRKEYKEAATPDVILLDLGLPRINGYEVLWELKQDPAYKSIPVVILTTSCSPLDRNQCESLGADVYLSKPHSLKGYEELVQQLSATDLPKLTHNPVRKQAMN